MNSKKQRVKNAIQKVFQLDQGQQLNETPDISKSSGEGFTETGKVYMD